MKEKLEIYCIFIEMIEEDCKCLLMIQDLPIKTILIMNWWLINESFFLKVTSKKDRKNRKFYFGKGK